MDEQEPQGCLSQGRLKEIDSWFFVQSPDMFASSMADELIAEVRRLQVENEQLRERLGAEGKYR